MLNSVHTEMQILKFTYELGRLLTPVISVHGGSKRGDHEFKASFSCVTRSRHSCIPMVIQNYINIFSMIE